METKEQNYDENYIMNIIEQAKSIPEFENYKLCYVSNARDVEYVERQINNALGFAKMGVKDGDIVKTKIFRRDGQSYLFYFIKKDEVNEENKDPYKSIKMVSKYNTLIEYNIATGGHHSRKQLTGKLDKDYVDMVNHTVFIDNDDLIQKLNKIPVAQGTLKDGEADKKTFMQCFITARQKNSSLINLVRKSDGNNFYIYMEVTPAFADAWKTRKVSNRGLTYSAFVQELLNIVRVDLDQVKNACENYELIDTDGSVIGNVTKDKQAYIGKSNKSSFCLIGDPNFDRDYLANDYEKLFHFGNAYPIDMLLFLPSMEATKSLVSSCQKMQQELMDKGTSDGDADKFYETLKEKDPALSLYNLTNTNPESMSGEERLRYRHGIKGNYADKVYHSGIAEKIELYNRMYELRKRMNYRDPQQNNKLIPMKNAWDLGYQNIERQKMEQAFGELGRNIYDRYYYLQFLKYLLDTYKPTGALFDLTPMSKLFLPPEEEIKLIQISKASTADKDFAMSFVKYATLDDFISLVQRFDGVINVKRTHKQDNKKVDITNGFDKKVESYIDKRIGDIMTNWKMCENGDTFKEKGYAGKGLTLYLSSERKVVLRNELDKANTVKDIDVSVQHNNDTPADPNA